VGKDFNGLSAKVPAARAKTIKVAQDDLSGEERKRLDRMLRVNIYIRLGGFEVSGAFRTLPSRQGR
jgi:hypothetical protein